MRKTTKPLKIFCLTPENGLMKTPETYFAELMSKRGHHVHLQYTGYNTTRIEIDRHIFNFNPDVIWCMMEYALPTAVIYKQLLNKPLYSHIECIPPWRTGVDKQERWGFDYPEAVSRNMNDTDQARALYNDLINLYEQSDFKTMSGEAWRYTFEKFTNKPLNAEPRYYTFNTTDLEKYENETLQVKNQVCTISRFTPLKRVHHIIQALAKIDKLIRPKYVIVGYGRDQDVLERMCKELNVDVEFVGSGNNGIKNKVIQQSMFAIQISSGIPVLENAYYNKHIISYANPHMIEVYGDMCTWVTENDIDALSEGITKLIKDEELRTKLGKRSNEIMVKGECNIYTNQEFVERVEQDIEKTIHNFNNGVNKDDE